MRHINWKLLNVSFSIGLSALPLLPVIATVGLASSPASAAEMSAFDIAARSDRSDRGFGSSRVSLTMVLKNAAGKETTRMLEQVTLEIPDEDFGDKNLIQFESPADIRGTALLSHAQIIEPDAQWLFLPSLKRVKRISSANKSGPFVGSEFAFEDITGQELNKFSYRHLGRQPCGALTCDVLERTPRYADSGYTRQIAWIDTTDFQLRKVEFFDRRNAPLKTLEYTDYRVYDGGIWRPHRLAMVNHQTGKSTTLIYEDYVFGLDLTHRDFEKSRLKLLR